MPAAVAAGKGIRNGMADRKLIRMGSGAFRGGGEERVTGDGEAGHVRRRRGDRWPGRDRSGLEEGERPDSLGP